MMTSISEVARRTGNTCPAFAWSLPIHEEKENIVRLVSCLRDVARRAAGTLLCVFVENDSSDGSLAVLIRQLHPVREFEYIVAALSQSTRTVGVPRYYGFAVARGHIRSLSAASNPIFVSSDANAFPGESALTEIEPLQQSERSCVAVYPRRYDRDYARKAVWGPARACVERLIDQEEAYDRMLQRHGVVLVRGKGFALTDRTLSALQVVEQPRTREGLPLKGEAHQLGVEILRTGGEIRSLSTPFVVTPRRLIAELHGHSHQKSRGYHEARDGLVYMPSYRHAGDAGDVNCDGLLRRRVDALALRAVGEVVLSWTMLSRQAVRSLLGDEAANRLLMAEQEYPNIFVNPVSGALHANTLLRSVAEKVALHWMTSNSPLCPGL